MGIGRIVWRITQLKSSRFVSFLSCAVVNSSEWWVWDRWIRSRWSWWSFLWCISFCILWWWGRIYWLALQARRRLLQFSCFSSRGTTATTATAFTITVFVTSVNLIIVTFFSIWWFCKTNRLAIQAALAASKFYTVTFHTCTIIIFSFRLTLFVSPPLRYYYFRLGRRFLFHLFVVI